MTLRIFITGTDTGVGKTEAACALLSVLAGRGLKPGPFKPYESGCADRRRPEDALALKAAARSRDSLRLICPHRFELPVAPGVAARRLGAEPDFRETLRAFRSFRGRPLVAEGAGGLFVPIDSKRDVIDLIETLELPVLLVARLGLGTLNHTALSLSALRARGIEVRAVLLTKSAPDADPSEEDNASLIRERHRLSVLGPVPYVREPAHRRQAFVTAVEPLMLDKRRPSQRL